MSQQAGQGPWLRARPDADRGRAPGPTLTVDGPLLEATSGTHGGREAGAARACGWAEASSLPLTKHTGVTLSAETRDGGVA